MKKLIVAGSVAALSVAGLAGGAAFATATNTTSGSDPMSGLVSAIATKFNLNKTDVQKVFDDQRSQMDQERETQIKGEVAQLVKDGKLTQAQADKINAKRAELQKEMEANRTSDQTLSSTDRKTKMEERKTALDTWLKENSIDTQYAYLLMGGHGHGGPGGRHGDRTSDDTSTSSSSGATSSSSN